MNLCVCVCRTIGEMWERAFLRGRPEVACQEGARKRASVFVCVCLQIAAKRHANRQHKSVGVCVCVFVAVLNVLTC